MTAHQGTETLRFEEARVSLGDELRGARATLGRSLEQIETDLRIKRAHILAIEERRYEDLPGKAYISGFVRAYAKYLDLDADATLRRFYEEAGIAEQKPQRKSPAAAAPKPALAAGGASADGLKALSARRTPSGSGRGAFGLAAAAAVIAVIGFGGYYGMRSVGALDFLNAELGSDAGIETIPLVAAATPDNALTVRRPDASAYDGQRSAIWAPSPPPVEPTEAPMSALPLSAPAVQASLAAEAAPEADADIAAVASADMAPTDAAPIAAAPIAAALNADAERSALTAAQAPVEPVAQTRRQTSPSAQTLTASAVADSAPRSESPVVVRAVERSWLEVRDARGAVVFTGILEAGESYAPESDPSNLTLKTGNAGGVVLELMGVRFGPVGDAGRVVRNVSLAPDAVRARFGG